MFYLGLILAVCYVPGYTGAFIPTQWVLLSAILPLGLWRSGPMSLGHWTGLVVLAWSAISFLWVPNGYDWGYGMWLMAIIAGAFWLGSTTDPTSIFRGLAVGLGISSIVAIAQSLGYSPVEASPSPSHPAGLLYNPTVLGASCALVLIALCCYRLWWYIPALLPALFLSHSRGALIVLACTAFTTRLHWAIVSTLLIVGIGIVSLNPQPSDIQRLYLWGITLRNLDFFGHGLGSFNTFLYYNPIDLYPKSIAIFHPEFVHNDYLQLWFELGPGAIAIYLIYVFTLTQRASLHWPIFFAFSILGLFYFPLYNPIPAFVGALVAGRILSDWHLARASRYYRRSQGLLWSQL